MSRSNGGMPDDKHLALGHRWRPTEVAPPKPVTACHESSRCPWPPVVLKQAICFLQLTKSHVARAGRLLHRGLLRTCPVQEDFTVYR